MLQTETAQQGAERRCIMNFVAETFTDLALNFKEFGAYSQYSLYVSC